MGNNEGGFLVTGLIFGIFITCFWIFLTSSKLDPTYQKEAVFEDACNKSCNKVYKVNYMHVENDYWCMCKNGKVLKRDLNILYR